ncbi:MAG: glucose-1-phosphate cytidylyltransferase, partial [Thermoplasmata archaeon]|nr:glucose-1-phosphate cytidylyltransferase [Thermoplasmata archaeon]
KKLISAHEAHGKIGTVTGVCPPSRYGELILEEDRVVSFTEKPADGGNLINGGYFVLEKKIFDYLDEGDGCVFERGPLERLASEGQLQVHHHKGFWQCMDTYRDYKYLNRLVQSANPPWVTW